MATAIHINYNDYSISKVTGVSGYRLCVSKISPASINDVDAVRTGIVFQTNTSSELKTFLQGVLTAMSAAKTANGWAYAAAPVAVGTNYLGDTFAFYHTGNGTTHAVIRQILKPYAAAPRFSPYNLELNMDGYWNEAGTDAKTFYDDLNTEVTAL